MSIEGLESLDAWQAAKMFALAIYNEVLPHLPVEEKWGLNQQLRRAAQSIPANVAEGHGRFYYQETIRFCYIARGSLEEVCSHLDLAHDLGYIPTDLHKRISTEADRVNRLINGYIAFLKRSRKGENEPGSPITIQENQVDYLPETDTPYSQD
jgi:four helix bundle protein